ncbi:alpha-L-fucosidase [Muriicola sp. Z0-33]|uniref:alpha-L-fucosidase n=1 Tax=Muriicola sp. Z0-33 TaxID=2816957 RepID=UPI002237CFC2|nr:alpha-L-fucosidase [Muriicola sp. Z0-33]MCW5516863.1 alpha-L-fucosidase [Muriicola sp. Z0-33]
MSIKRFVFFLFGLMILIGCTPEVAPPAPLGPIPSARQLAWHKMEYYAFVHFNMNTFTDMEWGLGGESPQTFNPTELDTRQWARVAKEAGMKGIIITAKHHDGFCLWPTKTTEHSVKNAPWKDGKGDVIKELAKACAQYDLKMGIYLSPWDRNHAAYGKPEYVEDFHQQLRELLTNYGEIFEVWFDGANGGSGYYGGANETRKIDNKTYYQWDETTAIVRELQPNAVIFSDGGPDIRWVGNEEGWANTTNWSIMRRDEIYPGWPRYVELRSGHEDGTHWLPAEVNVSIRPGWYYHPREDHQVKSLPQLIKIYYESIGRNGNFLLNLPVDNRGLVHETDVQQLLALKKQIDKDFAIELSEKQTIKSSDTRGNSNEYGAENINDGDNETYWATPDGVTTSSFTLTFDTPTEVNRMVLQEYIPLGQRVQQFSVEAFVDNDWVLLDEQTTIGNRRILRFDTVKASKIKVNILKSKGPPLICNMELYKAPNFLTAPLISRNKNGEVSLIKADKQLEVYYTLDGSSPDRGSIKYTDPFLVATRATIKAIAVNPENGESSVVSSKYLDIPKKDWEVYGPGAVKLKGADLLIDEDPRTFWATSENADTNPEIVIDLGKQYAIAGFTYWPNQERYPFGIVTNYECYISRDKQNWQLAGKGEFANIVNSRIEQRINFKTIEGRYIKLRATQLAGEDNRASFAEVGVITTN